MQHHGLVQVHSVSRHDEYRSPSVVIPELQPDEHRAVGPFPDHLGPDTPVWHRVEASPFSYKSVLIRQTPSGSPQVFFPLGFDLSGGVCSVP